MIVLLPVHLLGQFLPGVFLLLVGFVGCNKIAAVAMLVLTYSANAFMMAAGVVSLFDIAPLYAGSFIFKIVQFLR